MTVNSVDEIEEFKLLKHPIGPLPLELPFTVSVVESLYIVQEFLVVNLHLPWSQIAHYFLPPEKAGQLVIPDEG